MDETYQKIELNSNQAKQKRAIKKILKKFYDDNIKPLQDIEKRYWRDNYHNSTTYDSVAYFDKVVNLSEIENKFGLLADRLSCLPYKHGLTHKDIYKMIVESKELQTCVVELHGVIVWKDCWSDGYTRQGCEMVKREYGITRFNKFWKQIDREFFLICWQCVLGNFNSIVPGETALL